jgi:hypothetical protein
LRIRIKTIASGPDFTAVPGQVIDIPDDQARDLIEGHYAEEVVDTAPAPAQADSAADQGDDQGGQAAQDAVDADSGAPGAEGAGDADPQAEYRAELTEKNVKTLKALVEAASIALGSKALKADMVDALVAHRVETAEAAAGENAAARTDAPEPRRRRQPSGKGPGG